MGFRLYFGNPNSKKALVVASGQTMQSLRNDQYLDAEIIDWMLHNGGEISRLDLAVTESESENLLTVEGVQTWYEKGLIESALLSGGAKTVGGYRLDLSHNLETFYVGSLKKRGKKGIFRAYDKGLELGVGEKLITRIELELKRESAHSTAKRLAETNDIAGNFRAKFNVRSSKFEELMDADAVNVQRGENRVKRPEEEETAKRWDWLIKQVAPALKEAIKTERKEGRGDARFYEFLLASGMRDEMLKAAFVYSQHVDYTKHVTKKKMSTLDLD
jgi:DNA relaxase NicK